MSSDVRGPLYEVGLNYRHGTGHGIGAYGLVHESPIQVDHHFQMEEGYSQYKL